MYGSVTKVLVADCPETAGGAHYSQPDKNVSAELQDAGVTAKRTPKSAKGSIENGEVYYNPVQAAHQDLYKNPDGRAKADQIHKAALLWTGAGVVLPVVGVDIALTAPAMINAMIVAYLSNPDLWNGISGDALMMAGGYEGPGGELSEGTSLAGKTAVSAERAAVEEISNIPNITYATKSGKYPSWETVKARYWKLMNKGKVPTGTARVKILKTQTIEEIEVSKELHHINGRGGADPHNFNNLEALWPWEHQAIDPSRKTGYIFLEWVTKPQQ